MKTKAIIFLLLLSSIACSSADYAATFHLDYETTPSPLSLEGSTSTMTIPAPTDSAPTALSSMQVCTGAEEGTLRVRVDAGTGQDVVAYLNEGMSVKILEEKNNEGGTWAKIETPAGWVNKRYLCEEKK